LTLPTALRELNGTWTRGRRYDAFVRTRQAATHSYVGYEIPINGLRVRASDALERLDVLMARQGHLLETVAVEELVARRERLVTYQNQARFAFARL
jgi:ribosomal 50S subunit-recycling heat shock protein